LEPEFLPTIQQLSGEHQATTRVDSPKAIRIAGIATATVASKLRV
jgi:hypothetical protein